MTDKYIGFVADPRRKEKKGSNYESVHQENRALILHMIKDAGTITRTQLAARSGLKQATITIIMKEFLNADIVREKGYVDGGNGRKIKGFGLANNRFATFAVRITKSYISLGVFDVYSKNIKVIKTFMDTFKDLRATCDYIYSEVNKMKKYVKNMEILGLGIAVEGAFVLEDDRYIIYDRMSQKRFDIGIELSNMLSMPVVVHKTNDFGAFNIWGDKKDKNGKGILVMIMISYTVECSIIINGEILHGSKGLAGQFGMMVIGCNKDGSLKKLDDIIAPKAILKKVSEQIDKYPDSVLHQHTEDMKINDVIDAYNLNDELAIKLFHEAAWQLAIAIANIINLINPDWILVGDEIPHKKSINEIMIKEIKKHVNPEAFEQLDYIVEHRERLTENDPSLKGASEFITDMALTEYKYNEL